MVNVSTPIVCVLCKHGAAKDKLLKRSSLKIDMNSMNCVKIGGHGMLNTALKEELI